MSHNQGVKPGLGYIDRAITRGVVATIPAWRWVGASPNGLTTLSLVTSALCVYFTYTRWAAPAIVFLFLRTYFDYADGILARRYDMATRFGDLYDHINDITFNTALFMVLVIGKWKSTGLKIGMLTTLSIALLLLMIQLGCIEAAFYRNQKIEKETSISWLRHACPQFAVPILNAFDSGTFNLVFAATIVAFSASRPP